MDILDKLEKLDHRSDAARPEKILRLRAVKAQCGLSRSTLYNRIAAGQFPSPVSLGARSVGWLESEVNAWIAERIADRIADRIGARISARPSTPSALSRKEGRCSKPMAA